MGVTARRTGTVVGPQGVPGSIGPVGAQGVPGKAGVGNAEAAMSQYGGAGDNLTLNDSAVTQAHAYLMANGGGVLKFGPGIWLFSQNQGPPTGIVWEGAGRYATIIKQVNSGNAGVLLSGASYGGLRYLQIQSPNGDGLALSTRTGVIQHPVFEDIWVSMWGAGCLGVDFIVDTSLAPADNNLYFPRFRNVDVLPFNFTMPVGSKCVGCTGTAVQVIGGTWNVGRFGYGTTAIDLLSADGCVFDAIEFDGIHNLSGTKYSVTGVNTTTNVVSVTPNHTLLVGQIVYLSGLGGLSGLLGPQQVCAPITSSSFAIVGAPIGGAWTSGGTAQLETGLCVHFGSNCAGCKVTNSRIEAPDVGYWVKCDSTSHENTFAPLQYGSPLPAQYADLGRNILLGSDGSRGRTDNNPYPSASGGTSSIWGQLTAASLVLAPTQFAPSTGNNTLSIGANQSSATTSIQIVSGVLSATLSGGTGYSEGDVIVCGAQNNGLNAILKVTGGTSTTPTLAVISPGYGYTSTSGAGFSVEGTGSGGTLTFAVLTGAFSIIDVNVTGPVSGLIGLYGGPPHGMILDLRNETQFEETLVHLSGSGTAGQRIACPTGVNVVLPAGESVRLEFDANYVAGGVGGVWRCRTLPPLARYEVIASPITFTDTAYHIAASVTVTANRTGKIRVRVIGSVDASTACGITVAIAHGGSTTPDLALSSVSVPGSNTTSTPISFERDLTGITPATLTLGSAGAPGTWWAAPVTLEYDLLMKCSSGSAGAESSGTGIMMVIEELPN